VQAKMSQKLKRQKAQRPGPGELLEQRVSVDAETGAGNKSRYGAESKDEHSGKRKLQAQKVSQNDNRECLHLYAAHTTRLRRPCCS